MLADSELIRFESRHLPLEFNNFLETVRQEHEREPFPVLDPRECVRRLGDIATSSRIPHKPIRGSIEVMKVDIDHVWLALGNPIEESVAVDLSLPLHNPDFINEVPSWVSMYKSYEEMCALAKSTRFEERVIGKLPHGVFYRGEVVWTKR